jgi:hypothetical protein
MKQTLKSFIPQPLWQLARNTYDSIRRVPELPAAYFHPWRRESVKRLAALKNIHKGKRAFIIGNGPSLKQTDLSKLKNEITFGMNRIYLAFPEFGFSTSYLCVTNDLVIEQFVNDFLAMQVPTVYRLAFPSSLSSSITNYQSPHFRLHILYWT